MSCTVSKDELKKSLVLLWKNIQDNYAKKSELPTVTSSVVVVDRKEEIINYSKNILYIIGRVPHVWDGSELVPLQDSKVADILAKIEESKGELTEYFAGEIDEVYEKLNSEEFINELIQRLPRVSAEKPGLMSAADKLTLEENKARLLDLVDRDDVNRWYGDIINLD